ncbi:MAG: beta-lactamase family protein [Clostridia bacterium]|nr:beta-lactamase family protein [Clostridia bacterium]
MVYDFTRVKQFLDSMAVNRSPGNAIVICHKGKKVFSYSAGYSDLEKKKPFTGEEYVNIYSCSKVTTVTAAAQLLERGAFLLRDPLYEYIPEYRYMAVSEQDGSLRDAVKPITVGDLFSMTAGFNYNLNSPSIKRAGEMTEGRYDTLTVVRELAREPLSFDPGTHWQYSLCHDVLAGLVEAVSGMKFRDYVKSNIFEPLGMTKSVYHHTEEVLAGMAEQYSFVPTGQSSKFDIVEAQKYGSAKDGTFVNVGKGVSHILGPEYDSGGAGITTTVEDYAKLAAALSCGGISADGERILSPYTVELMKVNRMTTPQLQKDFCWRQFIGYGYGLGVRTHIDRAVSGSVAPLGEFGWGGAAGASFYTDSVNSIAAFYVQHCLNPREEWYQPRLCNAVFSCFGN